MKNITPRPANEFQPGVSTGLFRLDFNTYQAEDALNNGAAKLILRSIAHWRASFEKEREVSPAMTFGSLVHCATLEPDRFGREKSHFVIPPTYETTENKCPKCGSVTAAKTCKACKVDRVETPVTKEWNTRSQTCQDWLESHSDLPIINAQTEKQVHGCRQALWNHSVVASALEAGYAEVSGFVVDPESGVRMKARFDLLAPTADALFCTDLKKVEDAEDPSRTFAAMKYHVQDAMYRRVLGILGFESIRFLFACHEGDSPHSVVVHELDEQAQRLGESQVSLAIARYKAWKEGGAIEGYEKSKQAINPLSLPRWVYSGNPD